MKIIICVLMVGYWSCKNNSQNIPAIKENASTQAKTQPCEDYDSLLIVYANNFKAEGIDLQQSISEKLDYFLLNIDTACLRQQSNYKFFVATILLKLYHYHLTCCNQGYDLLGMGEGGSNVIVNEFKRMGGYSQKAHLEFLNSAKVVDAIKKDSVLKENTALKHLLVKVNKEEKRILAGKI